MTSSGRTSWWPKDAAWHRRERNIELGEKFGAAGPLVIDVLACWSQEQRSVPTVLGGFRALAREAYTTLEQAREIVEFAGQSGALDDLVLNEDGRRFSCRVSGLRDDCHRGRAAWRKAEQRERDAASDDPEPDPPEGPSDPPEPAVAAPAAAAGPAVTQRDMSRSVTPSALQESRRQQQKRNGAGRARPHEAARVATALLELAQRHGILAPSQEAVDQLLTEYAEKDVDQALDELRDWASRCRPNSLLGAYRHALRSAPCSPVAKPLLELAPSTREDDKAWSAAIPLLEGVVPPLWLTPLRVAGRDGDALALEAPPEIADWVRQRFIAPLSRALAGRAVRIVTTGTWREVAA